MYLKKGLEVTFLGLFLIISFLSCNIFDHVYDNQTDPDYDGNGKYNYNLDTAFYSFDTIPVLLDVFLTCKDKGSDNHWYSSFDLISNPKDSTIFKYTVDTTQPHTCRFSFFFTDTFNGDIIVKATRPNGIIDSSIQKIHVINPYSITGDTIKGIGDTTLLGISTFDSSKFVYNMLNVLWSTSKENSIANQPFTLPFKVSSDSFDTVSVNAVIFRDSDSLPFISQKVIFNGHSPQIDSAKLLDPLCIGEVPRISIAYSDPDAGNGISFSVTINGKDAKTVFEPSNKAGSGILICEDILTDTFPRTITIVAFDNTNLKSVPYVFDSIRVKAVLPVVKFINNDELYRPPMNSPIILTVVTVKGLPVHYKWKMDGKELATTEKNLTLEGREDTTATHTITVQGIDTFNLMGPAATLKFRVAPYNYFVKPASGTSIPDIFKINQQYTFKIQVTDADQKISGNDTVTYVWSGLDTTVCTYEQTGPELKVIFTKNVPLFVLTAKAFVGQGKIAAAPLAIPVTISSFAPTCKFTKPEGKKQEINLDSTVSFEVRAEDTNQGGSVEEIICIRNQGNIPDTTYLGKETTWTLTFRKKGTCRVIAYAIDNESNKSIPDTILFTVNSERPQFTVETLDTIMYMKDSMYLHATLDYKYKVSYIWDRDSDGIFEDTTGQVDSIACYYENPGTYTVSAQCFSELGDTAINPMVFHIRVLEGTPVINKILIGDTTYPGKKVAITVNATDNGAITEYLLSLDKQTFYSTDTSTIDTLFTAIGKHYIYVKVKDDIGLYSDLYTDSVIVAHSEPQILSLKSNVTTTLIKKPVTFSIVPFDPDGKVKTVYFNWNGDTTIQDSLPVNDYKPDFTYKFSKTFTVADAGVRKVFVWAIDNDNQKSLEPKKITITVLKGEPRIDSVISGEIWVKKNAAVTINSSDTNGTIARTWIDWNNDGTWDDSSTTLKTFSNTFDTTAGDRYAVLKTKVMDDDNLTVTKACSIFVKMGRPVLSGGANYQNNNIQWKNGTTGLDTMFYVWNIGQVTSVAVDTTDINGFCKEFYWKWYKLGLIDNTTSVPFLTKEGLSINDTNRVTVTCIDNDTIRSKPYTFFVFPDAPPPSDFQIGSKYLGDPTSFTILWEGLDAKDDSATTVAMTIGKSLTVITDTVTTGFETARNFSPYGTYLGRTFNLQDFGYNQNFYFKVILKDARGSKVEKTSTVIFYP